MKPGRRLRGKRRGQLHAALPALLLATVLAPVGMDGWLRAAEAQGTTSAVTAGPTVGPIANTVSDELKARLAAWARSAEVSGATDAMTAFYEARNWQPVWVDAHGVTRAGDLLIAEFGRAGDYGLDGKDFALRAALLPRVNGAWTPGEEADADLEISTLVLKYANQARGGRIPTPESQLSSYIDRTPDLPDPSEVLAAVSASATPAVTLAGYQPQQDEFKYLMAAYNRLRAEAKDDSATAIAVRGPELRQGVRSAEVTALRRRFGLAASGDDADAFDDSVIAAVKAFQKSAGLSADGIVGNQTRRMLASNSNRSNLDRLRANMEAWRWMPRDLGRDYLFVNVPQYAIRLVRDGKVELSERVITGRSDKQTPIFSKELQTIVLRPQWHLPDSIKIEKLVSAQRRGRHLEDLGYVIKKGRRTVKSWQVNWAKANLSHYEISQPSGDGNALGDVKFLFPNKHSVYLHDTPSKSLFKASERTFSHGCIRLQNPLSVAQTLLDEDRGTGAFDVKRLVRRGPGSNQITLEKPLPIHIAYFTAWADADGNVAYFKDVYGHEKRITLALAGKWKAIDKGRDHLIAADTSKLRGVTALTPPANAARVAENGIWGLPTPMGATTAPPSLFKPAKAYKYKSDRNSVGEMMRRSLGGF